MSEKVKTRLDQLFRAAGEPTRLRILNLLQSRGVCVCEIQATLGLPQPTVSRHLAALRHAGLVQDTREGPRVMYSRVPADTPAMDALYELLDKCCPLEPRLSEDLEKLSHMARTAAAKPKESSRPEQRS